MGTVSGGSKENSGLIRSFLSFFYGNIVVLILGFIQTPLLTRLLGTADFGKTGMFETAVTIIYIFAILGMDQSYIRFYYAEGIDRRRLLFRCLFPSLAIVSALSVFYVLFSDVINGFLFGESGMDITVLVVVYTLICVLERFFFLDVRMQQNGKLYSNVNIAQKVLSLIVICVFFRFLGNDFRVSLYALVLSWGSTTAFIMLRYALLDGKTKGRVKGEAGSSEAVRGLSQKELIRYGLPFIAVLLMEWLLSSCDRVALRLYSSFEELGIYTSAMKIIVLLLTVKNTFVAYWSPVAMERFENAKPEENKEFFVRVFGIVRLLCVFMAAGLILFRKVIVLLLGADYRGAERMIPFLTLMPVFAILFEITNQSIKFSKRNWYLNAASLVAIVCNIAGNMLLVPRWGGLGAAVSTGLSYLVYFLIGSFCAEKCIRIGYPLKSTGLIALLLTAYCAEASLVSGTMWDITGFFVVIVMGCLLDRRSFMEIVGYGKKFFRSKKQNP